MKKSTISKGLRVIAVAIDVICPLVAIFCQFPVWVERSAESTVSGLFLVLCVIASIPLFRKISEFMKSPSICVIWLLIFVFFTMLKSIISEMIIVSFVGLISNAVGAIIYKIGCFMGGEGLWKK